MRKMLTIGAAALGGGIALAAAAIVGFRVGLDYCWSMLDISDLDEDGEDDGGPDGTQSRCAQRDCSECARERCIDCSCHDCCEACPYPKGACDCHPDGVPGWADAEPDPAAWDDEMLGDMLWEDAVYPGDMDIAPDAGDTPPVTDEGQDDGASDDDVMPEDMIEDYDPDQYL